MTDIGYESLWGNSPLKVPPKRDIFQMFPKYMSSPTHYTFYIINYFAIIWTIVEALPHFVPCRGVLDKNSETLSAGCDTDLLNSSCQEQYVTVTIFIWGKPKWLIQHVWVSFIGRAGRGRIWEFFRLRHNYPVTYSFTTKKKECESKAPFVTDEHMDVK